MKLMKKVVTLIVPCLMVFIFSSCKTPEYNLGDKDTYRLGEALLDAIARDEHLTAKRLIKRGAPLNYRDRKDNWTPLIYAIYYENGDIAEYLIKAGADVNCKDNLNRTALMFAAMSGDLTVLQMLIEKGADFNALDNTGKNSLTYATVYSQYHAAEYLAQIGYIPKDKPGNAGKGNKKPFLPDVNNTKTVAPVQSDSKKSAAQKPVSTTVKAVPVQSDSKKSAAQKPAAAAPQVNSIKPAEQKPAAVSGQTTGATVK